MDKIKLICKACGYEIMVCPESASDYDTCPICGCANSMVLDYYTNDIDAAEEKRKQVMQLQISQAGNNKVWEMIETFPRQSDRILYRKLFFELGGQVPEKEFTI